MANQPALTYARELEREDVRLSEAVAALSAFAAELDELRARAQEIADLRHRLPGERVRVAAARRTADEDLAGRREEAARAEATLAHAERGETGRDAVAAARRDVTSARDLVASAERRVGRVVEAARRLEQEAAAAERDAPALERRASELAGRLAAAPRIARAALGTAAPGVAGAVEWATRAAAAVLVARSGLETERERVVRQANELLASIAGEPAPASSVAQVLERLQRAR